MKRAACAGKAPNIRENPEATDPWFPGKGQSLSTGKIACFTCHVRAECADYRDRTGSNHGMWAGEILKKGKDENA